jgi:hypothetical protein
MIVVGRALAVLLIVGGLALALPQVFVDRPAQAVFMGGVFLAICGAALFADLMNPSGEEHDGDG